MKEKLNNKKGITLIALIITIIVLLILAIVSIKILIDQGIIGHAQNATSKYTVEQEKELIGIGYSNYQIQKFAATDTAELGKLQKYFSKPLEEIVSPEETDNGIPKFLNNEIIEDANTSLLIIGYGVKENSVFYRLTYHNNIYRLILGANEENIEKVEFESTITNTNEESKELKMLKDYFINTNDDVYSLLNNFGMSGSDNEIYIPDVNDPITIIGINMSEKIIVQYKNHIYALTVKRPETCKDKGKILDVELESTIFYVNILEVQGADVDGNEEYGWTITFEETGHVYILQPNGSVIEPTTRERTEDEILVEKYFLGENDESVYIEDVINTDGTFKDNSVISDASTGMQFFKINSTDNFFYTANNEFYSYVKYQEKIYKVYYDVKEGGGSGPKEIRNAKVELIYAPNGKEGQTITYSYDGKKEHEEQWTILYDNGSNIEIISPNTIGNLTLGADNIDEAITSYNEAIKKVNQYCKEQINNRNKISVRSAGSNPENPLKENTIKYTLKWSKNYDNRGKSPDNNWEQDMIRMTYWGVIKTEDAKQYWLASRGSYEDGMNTMFDHLGLRAIGMSEEVTMMGVIPLWSVSQYGYGDGSIVTCPVRPVVKINQ